MAFALGLLFGFVGSIPVAGPISLLVVAYGVRGRFRQALGIACGGAVAEAAYACLALWGLGSVVHRYPWFATNTRGVAALVLVALGAYFVLRKHAPKSGDEPKVDQRGVLQGLTLGLSLTAFNPTLLVTWSAAGTALFSSGIVESPRDLSPLPFAGGVALGIVLWFAALLALIRRYRDRLRDATLVRIERAVGVTLVLVGAWAGIMAIWGR